MCKLRSTRIAALGAVTALIALTLSACSTEAGGSTGSASAQPNASNCGSMQSAAKTTPIVAILRPAGRTPQPLARNESAALSTVVSGATNMGALLLMNEEQSSGSGTNVLDEQLVGDGPNSLFRGQDLRCKLTAVRTATAKIGRASHRSSVDVIGALDALSNQLQTAPHGAVNVVLVGSLEPTTPLASGGKLKLASPAAAIDGLARSGLNFRCDGWNVVAVDAGFAPDGAALSSSEDSSLEAFWKTYFRHCGGTLAGWTTELLTYPVTGTVASPDMSELPVSVAHTRRSAVITLHGDVAFALNRATLRPAATARLRRLTKLIESARGRITVSGYTDSTGGPAINVPLSHRRAASVGRWITAHTSVPATAIHVFGHGSADPVASNATAAGRARNRRVEIDVPTTRAAAG